MSVEQHYTPDTLREKLRSGGYEIVDERPVQGGIQLRCGCGAIATVYASSGKCLAQGKGQPRLEDFLNSDAGRLSLFSKNRVFVFGSERHEDALDFSEYLIACGIRAIPINLSKIDDRDYRGIVRQHRPFSASALFVGNEEEFSADGIFEPYVREMGLVFSPTHVFSLSPIKLPETNILDTGMYELVYDAQRRHEVFPRLFEAVLRRFDRVTRRLIVKLDDEAA